MPTTRMQIRPGQLGAVIKTHQKGVKRAIEEGSYIAATRVASYLKTISPVYDGHFKNAWMAMRAVASGSLAGVSNSAPHAGIIEAGARPHGVSREGVEAIREWVRKTVTLIQTKPSKAHPTGKRGLTFEEADSEFAWWVDEITWAIVRRLKEKGQKGRWLVRDNLSKFGVWAGDEISQRISAFLAAGVTV